MCDIRQQTVCISFTMCSLDHELSAVVPPHPVPVTVLDAVLNVKFATFAKQGGVALDDSIAVLGMHSAEPEPRSFAQNFVRRVTEDFADPFADKDGIAFLC